MLIERKVYGAGYGIALVEQDLMNERSARIAEGMAKPRVGETIWYGGKKAKITNVATDPYFGGFKVELECDGHTIDTNSGISPEWGSKNDQQTKHKRAMLMRALHGGGSGDVVESRTSEQVQHIREMARRIYEAGMAKPRVGELVWYGGDKAKIVGVKTDPYYGGWKIELESASGPLTVNPALSPEYGSKNEQQTERKRRALLTALRGVGEQTEGMPPWLVTAIKKKKAKGKGGDRDKGKSKAEEDDKKLGAGEKMVFGRVVKVDKDAENSLKSLRKISAKNRKKNRELRRAGSKPYEFSEPRMNPYRKKGPTESEDDLCAELKRLENTSSPFPEARARRVAELRSAMESSDAEKEAVRDLFRKHGYVHPGSQRPATSTTAPETQKADYSKKSIGEIAALVRKHWAKVNYGAKPYLDAMSGMDSVDDDFGQDSGRSIVNYFLSNANSWRGPEAKAVKAELKKRLGRK